MNALDGLLQGIVDDPHAEERWLVLADWLEEHDDPHRAELLRLHLRLRATCCEPERHPERAGQQARLVQLLTEGVRPCVPQRTVMLGAGVAMTFAWVPPGSFLMGSPPTETGRRDAEKLHNVTLTKGFFLGICPVTQAQWRAVMGTNPSHFKGEDLPVELVSWRDCQAFCTGLSARGGKMYRLPTEAEWEYACRAGTTTPFFFGETISADQVNYDGNRSYRQGTTPVSTFPPNAWGLYDMHGNVEEPCQDLYRAYPDRSAIDPQNSSLAADRLLRGASWLNAEYPSRGGSWCRGPKLCRSAWRHGTHWGGESSFHGCRVSFLLE